MSAAEKAIAALEAAGKAATPRPWDRPSHVGTGTSHLDQCDRDADFSVLSVNLSSPLAAVARAAMEVVRLERALAMPRGLGERFPKEELFALEAARKQMRAALDALEAAAEGVV